MNLLRLGSVFGLPLILGAAMLACGDDDSLGLDTPDADAGEASTPEGGSKEGGAEDSGTSDTGKKDSGSRDGGADADADAETPRSPGVIDDLAATADTHTNVTLTWTAPAPLADAGGPISSYELRYASTPITTEAEFLAATPAAFVPAKAGAAQTYKMTELSPATAYHFAVRATDDLGVFGPVSNDAPATTKARAQLLITEVAPANTAAEGGDFVELVATAAGFVADIEVRSPNDAVLHRFAALDVQVGDRIVLHFSGLPGPAGFAQEDTTNNKTSSTAGNASPDAFDIYLASTDLPAKAAAILVTDGVDVDPIIRDAVLYSNRDGVFVGPEIDALGSGIVLAGTQGEWMGAPEEIEDPQTGDECAFVRQVVNAAGDTAPACGGLPGYLGPGRSMQRNGVLDTNTRLDFFVAPQTRAATNRAFCPPEAAKLAITEVNPKSSLLELNVIRGGHVRGFDLRMNPEAATGANSGVALVTLPDLCPATGDTIVVHLGSSAGAPSETSAKDQHPAATNPSYYDGAWDVATDQVLPFATTVVLGLRSPAGFFVDAAVFSDQAGDPPAQYEASLAFVQGRGLWLPATCGGQPCSASSTPTARSVAASWASVDATAATSARRSSATASAEAGSWSVGASSFGQ